jgi:hypothetical protein
VAQAGSAKAALNFSLGWVVMPLSLAEWTIRKLGTHRKIHGASSQTMRWAWAY